MTWLDAGPFLRGVAWRDEDGFPLRANPADLDRLPWDVLERARVPVGVTLEFLAYETEDGTESGTKTGTQAGTKTGTQAGTKTGTQAGTKSRTQAVEIRFRAEPGEVPHAFGLWAGGEQLTEVLADPVPGETTVTVPLPPGRGPFTVHPPETQSPRLLGIRALGGRIAPAPPRPRWVVHGDSITEGWWSTRPAHAWPAAAGRLLGLEPVNLGHAGAGRAELAVAQQIAALPADVLTLAFGTNCWGRAPFDVPLLRATMRSFLALVRRGHPDTPLLVVSPVLRPAAEDAPNTAGATLGALRTALEDVVREEAAAGDGRLALLPGLGLLGPDRLADGLHPDDAGHALIAAAVAEALTKLLADAGLPTHGSRRAG
ncbi:GDSL-type esterase/lipase family protein [Streptomyces sp. NPDC087440]|uniref:GDSL-type esterase/lipase family protein n=1 Tax=Streptomyces sp. NPDC087440 TaxID=3365790 RepID=UPI0038229665